MSEAFFTVMFIVLTKPLIVEGDEAVQKLIFLNQRAKSKLAASLVASGPAGKKSESRISYMFIFFYLGKQI